jgi:hypothetical protein
MDDLGKMLASFLVGQMRQEPFIHFLKDSHVVLRREVLQFCINHQSQNVEQIVAVVAQLQKRVDRLVLEVLVSLRLFTSHSLDHFNVQSDR